MSAHLCGFLNNLDINEQKLKTEVTWAPVNDTDPDLLLFIILLKTVFEKFILEEFIKCRWVLIKLVFLQLH